MEEGLDPKFAQQIHRFPIINISIGPHHAQAARTALPEPASENTPPPSNAPIITKLRRQNQLLKLRISKQKEQIAAKDAHIKSLKDQKPVLAAMRDLIRQVRRDELDLPLRPVVDCFLSKCESVEEVAGVLAKQRTLKVAISTLRKTRRTRLLAWFMQNHKNVNHVFAKKQQLRDRSDSLAAVFGHSIIKHQSDTMLLYHHPIRQDLAKLKVKVAHFDGRYSGCPGDYLQSVELRLVLGDDDTQVTVTFARALLAGNKVADYEEFFTRVKNLNCPRIKHMVTDFELAVSRAALAVFGGMKVRGCWYHFFNNLVARAAKLGRVCGEEPCRQMTRVLSLLPFMANRELVIDYLITVHRPTLEHKFFSNANVRLLLYVLNTYVKRYDAIFFVDLAKNMTRTNNAAEGSNSGLARFKSQRATLTDFATYCEVQFKRDLVRKTQRVKPPTDLDIFLLQIQRVSKFNIVHLVNWLLRLPDNGSLAIAEIVGPVPKFTRRTRVKNAEYVQHRKALLDRICTEYREYRAIRRRQWQEFKERLNNDTEINSGLYAQLEYENNGDGYDKQSDDGEGEQETVAAKSDHNTTTAPASIEAELSSNRTTVPCPRSRRKKHRRDLPGSQNCSHL